MEKFSKWIEKYLMPVALKLNTIKGLSAVRDAFLQIFPLTLVGSLVIMINVVVLSSTGFIGQFLVKIIPTLDSYQAILNPVNNGTVSIMSIFIVFLIARNFAVLYNADGIKAGITAIASFFILYPPKVEGQLTDSYLGANGIFVALITGLVVGFSFSKLTKIDKLKIKLPETVPTEVVKSFLVAIPTAIVLVTVSVISYLVSFVNPLGLNDLIYSVLQKPMELLGASFITPIILMFFALLLWTFGIHGTATVQPIALSLYSAMNIANISYAAEAGTTFGSPYPHTWFVLFEHYGGMGGSGNTLCLIVAILILSRRKNWVRNDYTKIAKLSLIPGLFSINEPIIFGLPIVLNPIFMIPFILAPLVCMTVGSLMMSTGLVPPGTLDVGWTTPQPLKDFLSAAGSWEAVVSVLIVFVIGVLIYLPFVYISNKNQIGMEDNIIMEDKLDEKRI